MLPNTNYDFEFYTVVSRSCCSCNYHRAETNLHPISQRRGNAHFQPTSHQFIQYTHRTVHTGLSTEAQPRYHTVTIHNAYNKGDIINSIQQGSK